MSVIIKGMKMPENCCECPLETDYGTCGYYSLFVEAGHDSDWEKRRYDCPLIELPDHGDLIDREYAIGSACSGRIRTLPTTEDGENWIRVEEVRQSLKSVPAVIPAERSEASLCDNCDERSENCCWCKKMERSEDDA